MVNFLPNQPVLLTVKVKIELAVSALNLQLGELEPQNLAPFVGDTGLRSQVENSPPLLCRLSHQGIDPVYKGDAVFPA